MMCVRCGSEGHPMPWCEQCATDYEVERTAAEEVEAALMLLRDVHVPGKPLLLDLGGCVSLLETLQDRLTASHALEEHVADNGIPDPPTARCYAGHEYTNWRWTRRGWQGGCAVCPEVTVVMPSVPGTLDEGDDDDRR